MKNLKNLCKVVMMVSLGMTAATSYASDWDFSASVDGVSVTGSFTGTLSANGNYVDDISGISLDIGGVPVNAPTIYGASWGPDGYWVEGPVVSLDGADNNFAFSTGDLGGGDYNYTALFTMGPGTATVFDAYTGVSAASSEASWTLVDPVPDGGSTMALCGIGFAALGWLRRKLA
jgi:hypothetical protein